MSMNASKSNSSNLPFIAVEYGDLKAVISRNPSYQDTLSFIKKAFRSLRSVPDADIALNARFEGLDDNIRVLDDLWPELLPQFSRIEVTLDCTTWSCNDWRHLAPSMEPHGTAMMEVAVLIRRYGGLKLETGTDTTTEIVELPANGTVFHLAELVGLRANTPPGSLDICHDGFYLAFDTMLTDHGIGPGSELEAVFP